METNWVRIVAMTCAGIAVVSTVVGWVFKFRELKTLREIRDKLDSPEQRR